MKKSILFMSAVAMLAAASCNKPELENIDKAPELGAKEFVAYTEAPTKTQLNGLATEWEEGDVIDINGVPFVTNETGTKAIFKIDDDNSEFPEAPYIAGYPYNIVYGDANGNICFDFRNEHLLVKGEICDEVLAVAYSESDRTLEFNNVTSLVKFTIPEFAEQIDVITFSTNEQLAGDVVINLDDFSWSPVVGDDASSYNEIVVKSSEGFTPGETYYVPVLPGKKTNLTVKINNTVVATGISIEFKRNIIHNISTLPSAEVRTVYLKPGVWAADNAWFAAHFFGAADVDTKMVDSDEDGIYEVAVPNGATGVIFCRMNPDFTDFEWNKEDEEIKHVWDQTADLTVPAVDAAEIYYVVSDWAAGAWKTYEDATAEPVVDASAYGLVGSFQGWDPANPIAMEYVSDGWIVARNVELYKDDAFKFVNGKTWDDVNYGASSVLEDGVPAKAVKGGSNIMVGKNGIHDLYLNPNAEEVKAICVEEYTDLMITITIDNKANWSPLTITLKDGDNVVADKATVTNNKYQISGDYIGSTLTCTLSNGNKTSDVMNVAITKNGATITLEETIIKLKIQLNTANSKQWWGNTMKIHAWSTGTSFDTTWPGNTMTSEGNYTWSIIVPSELIGKTINYCVHNGNGWQSKDAQVIIKAEGNTVTGSSIGIN